MPKKKATARTYKKEDLADVGLIVNSLAVNDIGRVPVESLRVQHTAFCDSLAERELHFANDVVFSPEPAEKDFLDDCIVATNDKNNKCSLAVETRTARYSFPCFTWANEFADSTRRYFYFFSPMGQVILRLVVYAPDPNSESLTTVEVADINLKPTQKLAREIKIDVCGKDFVTENVAEFSKLYSYNAKSSKGNDFPRLTKQLAHEIACALASKYKKSIVLYEDAAKLSPLERVDYVKTSGQFSGRLLLPEPDTSKLYSKDWSVDLSSRISKSPYATFYENIPSSGKTKFEGHVFWPHWRNFYCIAWILEIQRIDKPEKYFYAPYFPSSDQTELLELADNYKQTVLAYRAAVTDALDLADTISDDAEGLDTVTSKLFEVDEHYLTRPAVLKIIEDLSDLTSDLATAEKTFLTHREVAHNNLCELLLKQAREDSAAGTYVDKEMYIIKGVYAGMLGYPAFNPAIVGGKKKGRNIVENVLDKHISNSPNEYLKALIAKGSYDKLCPEDTYQSNDIIVYTAAAGSTASQSGGAAAEGGTGTQTSRSVFRDRTSPNQIVAFA